MNKPQHMKLYRLFFGLLGFSAIITEIATLVERGNFNPANFFSFFTIESNILAVLILLYGAVFGFSKKTHLSMQLIRGAVVLYMLMTGVIFAVLLAGIEGATLTAVPWDNIVLHYIMPIVVLGDWLLDTPKINLTLRRAWIWLVFPLAYVAYSLIRGPLVNWYPYPFLNPTTGGYVAVTVTTVVLAVGVLIASWILCRTTQK